MTDEITKNMSDSDKLDFIINAVSDTNRRITMLEERQTAMETLVQNRLHDTRPIWEAVLQQLEALQEGQRRIEQKLLFIQQDHMELRTDVGLLSKRMDTLENLRQAA